MDRETKKYVTRVKNRSGVSSDGVPNRKGGSWPNHPSMRYELPIPFSPGADNVTDAYREGHERVFGASQPPRFCNTCDKSLSWCACLPTEKGPLLGQPLPAPIVMPAPKPCDACGATGNHRLIDGYYTCENDECDEP